MQSYSHGFGQSLYHVVLSPYKRFRMFQRSDIRKKLESILIEIAERHGFQIFEMSIEEDHVHIFLGHRPSQSVSEVIQCLKGASSRELRMVFPELKGYDENHLWSAGKCFRPIGEITPEKVEHYIRESQSHHYANNSDESEAIQKNLHHSAVTPQTSLQDFASQ